MFWLTRDVVVDGADRWIPDSGVDPPSNYYYFTQSIVCPNSCFGANIDQKPCVSREYAHRRRIFTIHNSKDGGSCGYPARRRFEPLVVRVGLRRRARVPGQVHQGG